jgi:hypothetical protein
LVSAKLFSPSEQLWTVAVTEEDQRELTTSQVVLLYAAATIDEGTYVWRDGMHDWCAPFEAPELRRALQEARIAPRPARDDGDDTSDAEDAVGFDDSDETIVAHSPLAGEQQALTAGMWHEPGRVEEAAPSFEDVTVSMDERETQGLLRKAMQADLGEDDRTAKLRTPFADAARAAPPVTPQQQPGFEFDDEEVTRAISTTEARAPLNVLAPDPTPAFELSQRKTFGSPSGAASTEASRHSPLEPHRPEPRAAGAVMTPIARPGSVKLGEKSESSVMYTLEALTRTTPGTSRPPPAKAVDLLGGDPAFPRQQPISQPGHRGLPLPPRKTRPEPVQAESTEPAGATLPEPVARPPVLARPALGSDLDEAELEALAPRRKKSKVLLLLALLVVGAAGASFVLRQPTQLWAKVHELSDGQFPNWPELKPPSVDPSATQASPANDDSPATQTAPVQALPSAEASADSAATDADSVAKSAQPSDSKRSTARPAKKEDPPEPEKATEAEPEKDDGEPDSAETQAAAEEQGPEFDRSAAAAALGAAAASASSCKTADGPTGRGRATVTFSNSGRAINANVTGAFAGTSVGSCVARLFSQAKVPAFSGTPVKVAKSFTVE